MATSNELNIARKNLSDVLGDSMKAYLQNLNAWFKKQLTKEEFDLEARKLMRNDTVHLHNEFLLALMAKCQSLSSSMVSKESSSSKNAKSAKIKKRPPGGRGNMQQRFVAAPITDYVPQITTRALEEGASPTPLGFVSREGLMPDTAMIHGRMLVCAWETGLSDVQDNAVQILILALESQLKQILSAVIRDRKGYKLREKHFAYSAGIGVKNPYSLRAIETKDPSSGSEATVITANYHHAPCLRPSVDIGEEIATLQDVLGQDTAQDEQDPISLFDLRDSLQLHKNTIVSHSVCSPALERILHTMHHPSHEELEQEDIHTQETYLKHKLAQRRDYDS